MIDIHAHILPGIDDGPADLDISLELCMSAYNRGVDIIIATPHYWHAVYQPLRHEVMEKIDLLTNELKKRKISIKVLPGMEVYLDVELPNWLKSKKIYTLGDAGKYVLVELPPQIFPSYTEIVLCKLLAMGITPILAHPERNAQIISNPKLLYRLLEEGVLLQITAGSLIGLFGKSSEQAAKLFLKCNWVDFIASDCHGKQRPYIFTEGVKVAEEIIGKDKTKLLVTENPYRVITGKPINTEKNLENMDYLIEKTKKDRKFVFNMNNYKFIKKISNLFKKINL
ncbi:phosphotransferase [Peptococcaceae bacterium]|nr:phosphotransferase [Peptococcaceae bacterium]